MAVHNGILPEAAVALFVFYTLYYICWQYTTGAARRATTRKYGCKAPAKYPQLDPILGLDVILDIARNLRDHTYLDYQRGRYEKAGAKTFSITFAGYKLINTVEPENIKTMLSLRFKDYHLSPRRTRASTPFLGLGIFTTDDSDWQHSRDLLRPNFVRSQIGDIASFEPHVNRLIAAIPRDGTTVNLQDLFYRLTINSSTQLLFGESIDGLTRGVSTGSTNSFEKMWNRAQQGILRRMQWGPLLLRDRRYNADGAFVRSTIDRYVDKSINIRNEALDETKEVKTEKKERYVFLHHLAKQTDDVVRIRDELLTVMMAGRDTTAGLLTNVWHTLSKRPDIWQKLRVEVDGLQGVRPTFEQLKEMKYLRSVVNESLRVYPIVFVNERTAIVDTVLPKGGGSDGESPVFVAKNTTVMWATCKMHRLQEYYGDDAEEFRPERWESLRPGWEYLPFNGGPRTCLGRKISPQTPIGPKLPDQSDELLTVLPSTEQFALVGASYTTVRLMQEFQTIESRDSEPWRERLTLSCTNDGGAKVALF